jgi:hypothetical protein
LARAFGVADDLPYKSFTKDSFRSNLALRTGVNPKGFDAHHVLPQKFEKNFNRAGVDIHNPEYGAWWQSSKAAGDHQTFAAEYNNRWSEFFRSNNNPTVNQIKDFGRKVSSDYGIKTTF